MIQYCENCRYYQSHSDILKCCLRYPVKVGLNTQGLPTDTYFPLTKEKSYCGEWKEQQECDCYVFVHDEITEKDIIYHGDGSTTQPLIKGHREYNKYCPHCKGTGKIRR